MGSYLSVRNKIKKEKVDSCAFNYFGDKIMMVALLISYPFAVLILLDLILKLPDKMFTT